MRTIGIAALLTGGLGVAYVLLKASSLVVFQSKALLEFVLLVRNSVENYSMSVSEILNSVPNTLMRDCGYSEEHDKPNSLSSFFEHSDIKDLRIKAIVSDFSREFGKSYRSRQSELCGICVERLRLRIGELEREMPKRRKMIISVCIACALILVLLLL